MLMQVPYFNAPMFLQNKTQIGKIEEIFGAINDGVCLSLVLHPGLTWLAIIALMMCDAITQCP